MSCCAGAGRTEQVDPSGAWCPLRPPLGRAACGADWGGVLCCGPEQATRGVGSEDSREGLQCWLRAACEELHSEPWLVAVLDPDGDSRTTVERASEPHAPLRTWVARVPAL